MHAVQYHLHNEEHKDDPHGRRDMLHLTAQYFQNHKGEHAEDDALCNAEGKRHHHDGKEGGDRNAAAGSAPVRQLLHRE